MELSLKKLCLNKLGRMDSFSLYRELSKGPLPEEISSLVCLEIFKWGRLGYNYKTLLEFCKNDFTYKGEKFYHIIILISYSPSGERSYHFRKYYGNNAWMCRNISYQILEKYGTVSGTKIFCKYNHEGEIMVPSFITFDNYGRGIIVDLEKIEISFV